MQSVCLLMQAKMTSCFFGTLSKTFFYVILMTMWEDHIYL